MGEIAAKCLKMLAASDAEACTAGRERGAQRFRAQKEDRLYGFNYQIWQKHARDGELSTLDAKEVGLEEIMWHVEG